MATRILALPLLLLACQSSPSPDTTQAPPVRAHGQASNDKFTDPAMDASKWIGRFEKSEREVFAKREAIVAAMGIEPGQTIADIGAGTGAFLPPLIAAVGSEGKVVATELSSGFRTHLTARGAEQGWSQLQVIESFVDRTGLPDASVDAVLLVDVYHHLEQPESFVVDVGRALKPGGRLFIVDFDPGAEDASDWVKTHVHLDANAVRAQVQATGLFEPLETPSVGLVENRMLAFGKK